MDDKSLRLWLARKGQINKNAKDINRSEGSLHKEFGALPIIIVITYQVIIYDSNKIAHTILIYDKSRGLSKRDSLTKICYAFIDTIGKLKIFYTFFS
jgi:hypothetical protein